MILITWGSIRIQSILGVVSNDVFMYRSTRSRRTSQLAVELRLRIDFEASILFETWYLCKYFDFLLLLVQVFYLDSFEFWL